MKSQMELVTSILYMNEELDKDEMLIKYKIKNVAQLISMLRYRMACELTHDKRFSHFCLDDICEIVQYQHLWEDSTRIGRFRQGKCFYRLSPLGKRVLKKITK
jgi:hypothetical protein